MEVKNLSSKITTRVMEYISWCKHYVLQKGISNEGDKDPKANNA